MNQNLLSWEEAKALRAEWAEQGQKVVFTNGCFDLLHPGHIQYLNDAKALGDKLIMGLNADASISRLKGNSRPINPLKDRASMLMGLKSIDAVVAFEEDTPQNLIALLLPDVLVKGGDYTADDIVGAKEVRDAGGEVIVVPFLDGYSSSKLIERIKAL
ncbi:D-glycero-beta-D-manno-heptose 1-phosphate adenylyltransferase [Ghiorsea bivora]|uniref:D-glycero-beta-D-manno-heptose 1-phosphate adenylyltransferase n=1 Tax=Ghiorsea bivora TaxID=1485545 RepID=UPI00056EDA80|nr:D-glycero-beta-D-manno-heptose 1-phosphate adenylyltransferase [Ghiorsea bivora]